MKFSIAVNMTRRHPDVPMEAVAASGARDGHHGRNYERLGVDHYCYGASFGLPHDVAMRSLTLFGREVMPHFRPASTPAR